MKPIRMIYCRGNAFYRRNIYLILCILRISVSPPPPPPPGSMQMTITCGEEPWPSAGGGGGESRDTERRGEERIYTLLYYTLYSPL